MGVHDRSVPYEKRHRLRICHRHIRADKNEVEVRGNEDRRAYYAGLMTCGSVWVCPVCAAKIQAFRTTEVRRAIEAWKDKGGTVLMMGPTVPHTRSDSLRSTLEGFNDAMQRFYRGAPMKRIRDAYGIAGTIKGLEVTWGQANGWHPHAHVLMFLESEPDVLALRSKLFERWESATRRAGFDQVSPKAFSLQDGGAVRTYVTKLGSEYQWNAEHELVKSHTKKARNGGYSPFDLLGANLDTSRPHLLALFREFGETFHGRNQLVWSRGLKQRLLGTDGPTDEEVAESIGENDPVFARIPADLWSHIRRHNLQGEVLQVADLTGHSGLRHLFDAYRQRFMPDPAH